MLHTPKPWILTSDNRGMIPTHFQPLCVIGDDGTQVICRLPDGLGKTDFANGYLLAGAPELLAASMELLRVIDALGESNVLTDWPVVREALDTVRAAVSNANND